MSETIAIPAVADIFPNSDGSESAQKLLRKVLTSLNKFPRENVNSLLNCCEVDVSAFPLHNIEFVAAKLKEQGHHARLMRSYEYDEFGGCWRLTFQISSVPFPPTKFVRWWLLPFYIFLLPLCILVNRTTYTVY